jgi:hypothetical protein
MPLPASAPSSGTATSAPRHHPPATTTQPPEFEDPATDDTTRHRRPHQRVAAPPDTTIPTAALPLTTPSAAPTAAHRPAISRRDTTSRGVLWAAVVGGVAFGKGTSIARSRVVPVSLSLPRLQLPPLDVCVSFHCTFSVPFCGKDFTVCFNVVALCFCDFDMRACMVRL